MYEIHGQYAFLRRGGRGEGGGGRKTRRRRGGGVGTTGEGGGGGERETWAKLTRSGGLCSPLLPLWRREFSLPPPPPSLLPRWLGQTTKGRLGRLTPSCCQPRGSRSGPVPSRRSAPPGAARSPPPPRRSRRSPPSRSRALYVPSRSATTTTAAATTQPPRRVVRARARLLPPSRLAGQVVVAAGRRGTTTATDDGDDGALARARPSRSHPRRDGGFPARRRARSVAVIARDGHLRRDGQAGRAPDDDDDCESHGTTTSACVRNVALPITDATTTRALRSNAERETRSARSRLVDLSSSRRSQACQRRGDGVRLVRRVLRMRQQTTLQSRTFRGERKRRCPPSRKLLFTFLRLTAFFMYCIIMH